MQIRERVYAAVVTVAPSDSDRVLPNPPNLLKLKLLLKRAVQHSERALTPGERLGVRRIAALLFASGTRTVPTKHL